LGEARRSQTRHRVMKDSIPEVPRSQLIELLLDRVATRRRDVLDAVLATATGRAAVLQLDALVARRIPADPDERADSFMELRELRELCGRMTMRVLRGAPIPDGLARDVSIAVLRHNDVVLAAIGVPRPPPLVHALAAVMEDATTAAGLARPLVDTIVERANVRLASHIVDKLAAGALVEAALTYAGRAGFDRWACWTVSTWLGRHMSRAESRKSETC
jgi:hypothetical protein